MRIFFLKLTTIIAVLVLLFLVMAEITTPIAITLDFLCLMWCGLIIYANGRD